jgi:outer membrane receptor for ferrienterochelin and colicins
MKTTSTRRVVGRWRCISALSLSLSLWLWLCCASRAYASDADLQELLGQSILSTPSKESETDTTAPATATVITADQLRQLGIRSLDEAINYLSLGMATSTPSHTAEIGARGVLISADYGNHVLLLVDGHALNEPWNGTAYFERGAGIPFELIDHIEVMLGPGSVLYGSQAMLGVIHVVTKRARDFGGVRLILEGDVTAPMHADGSLRGPASSGFVGDLGLGGRLGAGFGRRFRLGAHDAELIVGIDHYSYDGPTWRLRPQPYGIDSVTLEPKNFGSRAPPGVWGGELDEADTLAVPAGYARFSLADFRAALRVSAYQRSTVFPDEIISSGQDFDDPFNREVDRFANLELSQRLALSSRLELLARGYADLYDYRWFSRSSAAEDCPEGLFDGCVRRLEAASRALGGELRATLHWPVLRASTLFGMDAKVRDVEDDFDIHSRTVTTMAEVASVGSHRTDGLLAPYVAQSLSPTRWLDLNLGLRLDHDSRFGNKLSPRSALGVTPWDGGRLKLIYAEAFRAPSSYELTYRDPNSQTSPTELGPETVRSIETSVEQRFGHHRLLLGVFRSWWTDLIGSSLLDEDELRAAISAGDLAPNASEAYRRENLARIDNYGLNVAYDSEAVDGRLRFGFNITSATTRVDSGDGSGSLPLVVAPRTFGNARASYSFGGGWPTFGAALRFSNRRLSNRAQDGDFARPPSAPPLLAVRLAISGALRPFGLSWRAGSEYSFAKTEPYVIGANLYASDEATRAELAPIRRWHSFLGLQYVWEPSPGDPSSSKQP